MLLRTGAATETGTLAGMGTGTGAVAYSPPHPEHIFKHFHASFTDFHAFLCIFVMFCYFNAFMLSENLWFFLKSAKRLRHAQWPKDILHTFLYVFHPF